ncbi:MAG: inositol monophosphatase family protein [Actinomycetota bacterium]|nr:inositol monophosphatase family protein [Actinomycetota bacterium]
MRSYQTLVGAAKTFAIDAAELINSSGKRHFAISSKSSSNDMVTEVDQATENYLVERISKKFPNHSIIAEEGANHSGTSEISWVIDPIDGTTNFIYGFPSYSVSIGVRDKDRPIAGAIYNISENSLYWAGAGMGAYKGSSQIRVRTQVPVANSLIGTGFGYTAVRRVAQARFLTQLIGEVRDIRRAGAASLDLCYVAEGRLDGYYESGLWPWDYTAASVIVKEAGGTLLGPKDTEPSGELTVAASNAQLAAFLREKILPYLPFPE